jgi:hypothetical protein
VGGIWFVVLVLVLEGSSTLTIGTTVIFARVPPTSRLRILTA